MANITIERQRGNNGNAEYLAIRVPFRCGQIITFQMSGKQYDALLRSIFGGNYLEMDMGEMECHPLVRNAICDAFGWEPLATHSE